MIVENRVAFDFAVPQVRHTPDQFAYVYPPGGFEAADMTWSVTPALDPQGLPLSQMSTY